MKPERRPPGRRRDCLHALLAAGAGLLAPVHAALAAAPERKAEGFFGTPLAGESQHIGFSLADLDGRQRRADSFPGSVLVLFFGFLSCPSICPSTLAELTAARRAMGPLGRQVRLAFATLDPERDTVDAMRAWLRQFDSDLIGLRDTPQAIARATQALRLDWQRVPGRHARSYTIDHGVQSYCYDPRGRLRLLLRPGPSPQEVASDFRKLLAGA